jgi:hypothetical protein
MTRCAKSFQDITGCCDGADPSSGPVSGVKIAASDPHESKSISLSAESPALAA